MSRDVDGQGNTTWKGSDPRGDLTGSWDEKLEKRSEGRIVETN